MNCTGPGATHHYACDCREKFYNDERIRMIRQFQKIQKRIAGEQFATPDLLDEINEMCRDGIAPERESEK